MGIAIVACSRKACTHTHTCDCASSKKAAAVAVVAKHFRSGQGDTPHALKGGGFLRALLTSSAMTSQFPRVEGTVPHPVHRETIRCASCRADMPWRTVLLHRQDIDRTHAIAVPAETTLPAGGDPAAWFVPTPALRARLTLPRGVGGYPEGVGVPITHACGEKTTLERTCSPCPSLPALSNAGFFREIAW